MRRLALTCRHRAERPAPPPPALAEQLVVSLSNHRVR